MKKIKYLSLFSGIGGFEVGIKNSKYGERFECISYAEIDKYASSIYARHFPEHKNLGDVREINTSELPDFDFLVGGFPCQAFSVAGKRKGFEDTRGTLFFEIARILKDKRPRYFLLENVRGILSHDKGKTFKRILEVLSDLGYTVQWTLLNSANFQVPQRRERVFIEGYLGGRSGLEVLSVRRNCRQDTGKINTFRDKHRTFSVYPSTDTVTRSLTGEGQNGGGGKSSLNPPVDERKLKVDKIKYPVLKRKYNVDIEKLQVLLRTSKKQTKVSNKEIATSLDLPLTHVSHWFRTDKHFSIPGSDIWFDLKDILKITDDSFDKAITEFEVVDGKYDMGNRVYSDDGLSPTLNCSNDGALIKEHSKDLKCLNPKDPQGHRVYDIDGLTPALSSEGGGKEQRQDCTESEKTRRCVQVNNDHKTYQDGRIYSTKGLSIALNARGNNGWYTDENKL